MQNWLQRAAVWLTWVGIWYSTALGFGDLRFWMAVLLLLLIEYLAAEQGAKIGVNAVLSLKQDRLIRLKALFTAASSGQAVNAEEVRRILRGD